MRLLGQRNGIRFRIAVPDVNSPVDAIWLGRGEFRRRHFTELDRASELALPSAIPARQGTCSIARRQRYASESRSSLGVVPECLRVHRSWTWLLGSGRNRVRAQRHDSPYRVRSAAEPGLPACSLLSKVVTTFLTLGPRWLWMRQTDFTGR
jgi:hypothetical protein